VENIFNSSWFLFMNERHKRLVKTAITLYERESHLRDAGESDNNLDDYSFIIFPMSKAYEGFLKRSFLDLGIIDLKTFEGKRFRIGRALNPDVHQTQRDKYWLYDDIKQICGSEVARELWNAWLECRNRIFHFYAKIDNSISLETVEQRLLQLSNAMQSLVECQLDLGKNKAQEYKIVKKQKGINK
jgi:hypothetical protein